MAEAKRKKAAARRHMPVEASVRTKKSADKAEGKKAESPNEVRKRRRAHLNQAAAQRATVNVRGKSRLVRKIVVMSPMSEGDEQQQAAATPAGKKLRLRPRSSSGKKKSPKSPTVRARPSSPFRSRSQSSVVRRRSAACLITS